MHGVGIELGGHFRFNEARGNGIASDVAAPEFEGHRLGETQDARLGGRVVRLAGVALHAHDRGDVDNGARTRFEHGAHHRLGQVEAALQIDADDAVPLLLGHAHEQGVVRDARVVDDDVDRAKGFNHFAYETLGVGHACGIGLEALDGASPGAEFLLEGRCGFGRAAVRERHFGALGDELLRDGFSDAT